MKKDAARHLEKQKSIVNAVVTLMDEQGLKKVSILDICAAAGVSVGAFYHYFPSKDHIVPAMYSQLVAHMKEVCADRLPQMDAPDAILTFFDQYADYITQWGTYANRLTAKNALENRDDYEQHRIRLFELLLTIVTRGLDSGALISSRPAYVLTEQLFIITRGCNFEWAKRGEGFPCAEYTHDTVAAFMVAIKAPPTGIST